MKNPDSETQKDRHPWTFDDLILVLDWRMRHGSSSGKPCSELLALTSPHPEKSVRAQIRNFDFLDPMTKGGLPNKSKNAEWVWHIFGKKEPGRLHREAKRIKKRRTTIPKPQREKGC
ncbi:MAG: hypothetical protein OXF11_21650 [Deltaproteobacteria bacterium]|nr:hypothetical protein [Deltaproteobacteria bacterium]